MLIGRLVVAGLALALLGAQPAPRLMTAKDTFSFVNVGSPAISPDDQWVLYTRTARDWDDAQLRTRTHIWRVRMDGTGARQLTFGADNTTAPAWFSSIAQPVPFVPQLMFVPQRLAAGSPDESLK